MFQKVIHKLQKDKRIASFGADTRKQVFLFLYSLLWSLLVRLGWRREIPFSTFIRVHGKTVRAIFCDASDLTAFREVFVDDVYAISLPSEPKTIVDAGSNAGFSVLYFMMKYPNALLYAFEPNPVVFRRLVENSRQFGKSVRLFQEAVAGDDGVATLWAGDLLGSSLFRSDQKGPTLMVSTKSLDTIIREQGLSQIDLLKFDIEGAEVDFFSHSQKLDRVRALVGEFHADLSGTTPDVFKKFFPEFSYTCLPLPQEGRFNIQAFRL